MSNPRYAPGGDLYTKASSQYGIGGADKLYQASLSDDPAAMNNAFQNLRGYGAPLDESTASIFWDQVTSDPLAAPLESANNQINKAVGNVFKNPAVLIVLVLLIAGAFFYFFGPPRRR